MCETSYLISLSIIWYPQALRLEGIYQENRDTLQINMAFKTLGFLLCLKMPFLYVKWWELELWNWVLLGIVYWFEDFQLHYVDLVMLLEDDPVKLCNSLYGLSGKTIYYQEQEGDTIYIYSLYIYMCMYLNKLSQFHLLGSFFITKGSCPLLKILWL